MTIKGPLRFSCILHENIGVYLGRSWQHFEFDSLPQLSSADDKLRDHIDDVISEIPVLTEVPASYRLEEEFE